MKITRPSGEGSFAIRKLVFMSEGLVTRLRLIILGYHKQVTYACTLAYRLHCPKRRWMTAKPMQSQSVCGTVVSGPLTTPPNIMNCNESQVTRSPMTLARPALRTAMRAAKKHSSNDFSTVETSYGLLWVSYIPLVSVLTTELAIKSGQCCKLFSPGYID
jgi:hypothetical protein